MKNSPFSAELHNELGAPSRDTVESLRLLKAFAKLAPRQRLEVVKLAERLAGQEVPSFDGPLS